MTEWICCFYGCLTTYKNWISQLISFVRYCILKNLAFWLIYRFLDHYSRNRFFPNIWFLQKVRIPAVLSCSSKKGFNELDFCENPQNIIFGLFFWHLGPSWPSPYFFSKIGLYHFSFFMTNVLKKIRKNWWSNPEILCWEGTNGRTNRASAGIQKWNTFSKKEFSVFFMNFLGQKNK